MRDSRIEELRIQLDAFFEHVDEHIEEAQAHKTAAKEKLLELEMETDARIAAQKELEDSEFVKDSLTLDAGCRDPGRPGSRARRPGTL